MANFSFTQVNIYLRTKTVRSWPLVVLEIALEKSNTTLITALIAYTLNGTSSLRTRHSFRIIQDGTTSVVAKLIEWFVVGLCF